MAMDKPRVNKKKKRRPYYIAATVVVAVLVTVGVSQLEPAPPAVDRAIAWMDTVERGPMVRQVGGPGTLVPEEIWNIPAVTAGRVEEIYARPGTEVVPGTPLLRLSNPDVQLQLLQAQRDLTSATTALESLRATLQTDILNLEAGLVTTQTQYSDAVRQDSVNQQLLRDGLIAANLAAASRDRVTELKKRLEVEEQRLELQRGTVDSRLEAQVKEVERFQQIVEFRENELNSMHVVSSTDGILQQLGTGELELGQWVNPGFQLARIVKPERLKAVLRIPETQAVDVAIGQVALIDTRNGVVEGHVVRIDPSAQGGTVGVDVALPLELPQGARPDLSVDGKIEIQRLSDVLHMQRPQYGSANSTISLFKLEEDERHATRVVVELGPSSVNEIVVTNGLSEGDIVILTDLSQFDSHNRVRLRN